MVVVVVVVIVVIVGQGKGKAIPGSTRLILPDFMTIGA